MRETAKAVAERFPRDVAGHAMYVMRDDHFDRHVRFKNPDSYNMGFDLITWRGHLCYTGDMGTFVFARIDDMFKFFHGEPNPQYWSEKVLAADRDGVTAFSPEMFKQAIRCRLDSAEASPEVRAAAEEQVMPAAADGEHYAYEAARHFEHEGFTFADFWEANCRDYTYRFLWCCHALVWAIEKFNAEKAVHSQFNSGEKP